MAFSKRKKNTFYLPNKDFEVIYSQRQLLKDHDSWVPSRLPMACFTAALLEVFMVPPSMTSLTMPEESQGNGRLTARASC